MTRTEFIKGYAERSGLDDKYSVIGELRIGDDTLIALPCACGDADCEGWAMLRASSVLHHLAFNAPDELRAAYREAIGDLIA